MAPAQGASAVLALALALAVLQQPHAAAAQGVPPPMPPWARGPYTPGPGAWKAFAIKQHGENQALVAAANAQQQRWDFVMCEWEAGEARRPWCFCLLLWLLAQPRLQPACPPACKNTSPLRCPLPSLHRTTDGDSITQLIKRNGRDTWARLFPPATWRAAPLGISGNDIQDLAWRLWSGTERPAVPPRVAALLIGLNNVQGGDDTPAQIVARLEAVVNYLQAVWPGTKLLLIGCALGGLLSVAGRGGAARCMQRMQRPCRTAPSSARSASPHPSPLHLPHAA